MVFGPPFNSQGIWSYAGSCATRRCSCMVAHDPSQRVTPWELKDDSKTHRIVLKRPFQWCIARISAHKSSEVTTTADDGPWYHGGTWTNVVIFDSLGVERRSKDSSDRLEKTFLMVVGSPFSSQVVKSYPSPSWRNWGMRVAAMQ